VDLRLPLAVLLLMRSPGWWVVSVCRVKPGRNAGVFELFLSWWLYSSLGVVVSRLLFILLLSHVMLSFRCCGELLLFGWFATI
jgi:hypothetical protein